MYLVQYGIMYFITSPTRAVEKYCDECVCLCVCLSVRQDISGTPRAIFTNFWATVCKTVRPMLSDRWSVVCPVMSVCLSVCDVGVSRPNGWMDQDETWHVDRIRPRPISVVAKWLDGSRCHLVGR